MSDRNSSDFDGVPQDGMSLRDYFAGQVLEGTVANETMTEMMQKAAAQFGITSPEARARYCYELADAMIAERDREPHNSGGKT